VALQAVAKSSPAPPRGAITVEYFYKRRDPQRVEYALRELGYQVKVEQAQAEDVATNAISYGQRVPLADVRIIALAVARTGAQIRRICPFQSSRGRENVVQVIGSQSASARPPLDIRTLESLGKGSFSSTFGPLFACAEGAASAR